MHPESLEEFLSFTVDAAIEAGGVFTNLDGNPHALGSSSLACNSDLHKEIMKILG